MPYIKLKDREPYMHIIEGVLVKFTMGISTMPEEKQLIKLLKRDEKKRDGDFNYIITRLLKRAGWLEPNLSYFTTIKSYKGIAMKKMLFRMLKVVYAPPKYERYNAAIGMLRCCNKEFKRRHKGNAFFIVKLLEEIEDKFYDKIIAPYEDEKIQENTDVTF